MSKRKPTAAERRRIKLGAEIKKARLAMGASQEKIAKKLKTAATVVSRYENGKFKTFDIEKLREISNALKMDSVEAQRAAGYIK